MVTRLFQGFRNGPVQTGAYDNGGAFMQPSVELPLVHNIKSGQNTDQCIVACEVVDPSLWHRFATRLRCVSITLLQTGRAAGNRAALRISCESISTAGTSPSLSIRSRSSGAISFAETNSSSCSLRGLLLGLCDNCGAAIKKSRAGIF